jgi:hypothetical protein
MFFVGISMKSGLSGLSRLSRLGGLSGLSVSDVRMSCLSVNGMSVRGMRMSSLSGIGIRKIERDNVNNQLVGFSSPIPALYERPFSSNLSTQTTLLDSSQSNERNEYKSGQ